ncbi:MAG TPA: 2OG-Fe(II) oxygenase [Candidatus Binatia bacterium]|nr:2OG-Fe(II) oxygenase [Candidatus Binatia bacterium]
MDQETETLPARIAALDWERIGAELDALGHATTGPLLTAEECAGLAAFYDTDARFRSHIRMARHGFGSGEYKYFSNPLPEIVAQLRTALYPRLATVANGWQERLGGEPYPTHHKDYLARCHAAGQSRPTPLLLKYRAGDYNCLHQDLYGDLAFPLQATILLSAPEEDFTGGALVLTEQRPRMQSRAEVVTLQQGEAVIFAVNQRPVVGKRGVYRVTLRHGVSRVLGGERFTLGVIFHDAK